MRIHMLCGGDALDDVLAKCDALDDAARSLSVKPVEIPEAVEKARGTARSSESRMRWAEAHARRKDRRALGKRNHVL